MSGLAWLKRQGEYIPKIMKEFVMAAPLCARVSEGVLSQLLSWNLILTFPRVLSHTLLTQL